MINVIFSFKILYPNHIHPIMYAQLSNHTYTKSILIDNVFSYAYIPEYEYHIALGYITLTPNNPIK